MQLKCCLAAASASALVAYIAGTAPELAWAEAPSAEEVATLKPTARQAARRFRLAFGKAPVEMVLNQDSSGL